MFAYVFLLFVAPVIIKRSSIAAVSHEIGQLSPPGFKARGNTALILILFLTSCRFENSSAQNSKTHGEATIEARPITTKDSVLAIFEDSKTRKVYRYIAQKTGKYSVGTIKIGIDGETGDSVKIPTHNAFLLDDANTYHFLGTNLLPLTYSRDRILCYNRDAISGKLILASISVQDWQIKDTLSFPYPFLGVNILSDSLIAIDEGGEVNFNILFFNQYLKHQFTYSPFKDSTGFSNWYFKVLPANTICISSVSSANKIKLATIDFKNKSVHEREISEQLLPLKIAQISKVFISENGLIIYYINDKAEHYLTSINSSGNQLWAKRAILPFDYHNIDIRENSSKSIIAIFSISNTTLNISVIDSKTGEELCSKSCIEFFSPLSNEQNAQRKKTKVYPYGSFKWIDSNSFIFILCKMEVATRERNSTLVIYNCESNSFKTIATLPEQIPEPILVTKIAGAVNIYSKNQTYKYE